MKLSVITINFNNSFGLEKTINSILCQTYKDVEYIVIDGGSTDGSVAVIKKNANNIAFWLSEKDSGIYNAMNKGIAKATGDYVVFMNSGDYYLSDNILEKCYEVIRSGSADIYYGQIKIEKNGHEKTVVYPEKLSLDYLRKIVINHQACFFKKETLLQMGCYNENYKLAADYHYYLKAFINNKTFFPVLFPVVRYDMSGVSADRLAEYELEMNDSWKETIPDWCTEIVDKYLEQKKNYTNLQMLISNSRIIKMAFKIREIRVKLKNG